MDFALASVMAAAFANPMLLAVIILVLAVIVVNGMTDAANAIASAVNTRCIKPGPAIALAVVCNFAGLLIMSLFSTAVADTISHMVNFGQDAHTALVAIAAAMVAIVVWGVGAWFFGIPTSQSHSLIAGLTGSAIALLGFSAGVNWAEWLKVLYGLLVSTVLGFVLGWLLSKLIQILFARANRGRANTFFTGATVASAGMLAFMHGAQDGQKFMSIAMMAIAMGMGFTDSVSAYPIWLMVLCSLTMSFGTGVGGKRIIKSVGQDMTKLQKYQGFSVTLSASLCILLATLTGLPVSTTHTATSATMGAGAVDRLRDVKWDTAKTMVLTWIFTFPGCGLLGFLFAKLFMFIL